MKITDPVGIALMLVCLSLLWERMPSLLLVAATLTLAYGIVQWGLK